MFDPKCSSTGAVTRSRNIKVDKFGSRLEVQLAQADCISFLRALPEGSVDVIVTDPAYSGMNNKLQLGKGRIVGRYKDRGTISGDWFHEFEDTPENYDAFLSECRRVLNPETGHIYVMFDSYSLLTLGPLLREHFDVKNLITWDKVSIGMGHYFRRRHEFIIFATAGNKRKLNKRSFPDVWQIQRIRRAEYATQKPVELFQAMLAASALPGYTICDPFCGSGSSAVAAVRRGCHYYGSDISEKAIQLAARRLEYFDQHKVDCLQPHSAAVTTQPRFWEYEHAEDHI